MKEISITKLRAKLLENQDHEVAMAMSSLKEIVSNATQLMQKLGDVERNIPGWIQDHITNAENYIEQANQGFHELGPDKYMDEENTIRETEFVSLEDFIRNLNLYKNGDILKSQLITSYNRLETKDQEKAKKLAKSLNVLPYPSRD